MWTRITLAVTVAAVALGALAAPASALLSLTAGTGASLSPFAPGQTATGTGLLTAIASSSWTLTVMDAGTGAGHMVKAATGCAGSDPQLTNALTVHVTSLAGAVTSAGRQTIGATAATVASGTTLLTATELTTGYSQIIPTSQAMLAGCAYSLTATYTLQ